MINEGFENLETGLPTGWQGAYFDSDEGGYVLSSIWDLVYDEEYGAISGYKMLVADLSGLLLIPVQNAGMVSLKAYGDGEMPGEKQNRDGSLCIGVFSGDIHTPFTISPEAIKLEAYPNGINNYMVDLDGFTGYLFIYAVEGTYIDDVMVYESAPWTTINNFAGTSQQLSNLETCVTYQVQVQSICDANEVSRWATVEFTTSLCGPENQCNISYLLADSYNNGWEDAYISVVHHNTGFEIARLTETGSSVTGTLPVCIGETYDIVYVPGYCCNQDHGFVIYNHLGESLFVCHQNDVPDEQMTMFTWEVSCNDCYRPKNIDYVVDVTSATITWEPGEATQTAWELQYSTDKTNWTTVPVTSPTPVETMSYTIENLDANTLYFVRLRTNCGDGIYSIWTKIYNVRTDCGEYQSVPYFEDFNNYPSDQTMPSCWNRINTSSITNPPCITYDYSVFVGEDYPCLYFFINYESGTAQYAILPYMHDVFSLQMSFVAKSSGWYNSQFEVGVMTDPEDESTYTMIERMTENFGSEVRYFTVRFDSYQGENGYIAIKVPSEADYQNFLSIDNILVKPIGVELVAGWNWWVPTSQVTVADLEEVLGDNLVKIMAQDGEVTSGDLIPGEMYRLQVNENCLFTLYGTPAVSADVVIAEGSNWFGFIGAPADIDDVFDATFGPAIGDKIISQEEGFAIFNGTTWEGTLTQLVPGQGYVYVSNSSESKTIHIGRSGN